MNNKMQAYCGIDCSECDAYIATVNNDEALKEKTAKRWSELNNVPITADMMNCTGCRSDGIKNPFCDGMCEIRKCATSKNIDFCGKCPEFDSCKTIGFILKNDIKAFENLKKMRN